MVVRCCAYGRNLTPISLLFLQWDKLDQTCVQELSSKGWARNWVPLRHRDAQIRMQFESSSCRVHR